MIYVSDLNGNRRYHAYLWDLAKNERRKLNLPEIDTAAPPIRWSRDGRFIVVQVGKGGVERIVRADVLSRSTDAWKELGLVGPDSDFQISHSGRLVSFVPYGKPGYVRVVSTSPGQGGDYLACRGGAVKDLAWQGDDTCLYTCRAASDEYYKVSRLSFRTGQVTDLVRMDCDLQRPRPMPDSPGFVFESNLGGMNRIMRASADARRIESLSPGHLDTRLQSFSTDGASAFCLCSRSDGPPRLVKLNMRRRSIERAFPLVAATGASSVTMRSVDPRSPDGRAFHLAVWTPRDPPLAGLKGAVVYVHGGPKLQQRSVWDAKTQLLADRGFAFVSVNYRGSTGYGRTFETVTDPGQEALDVAFAVRKAALLCKVPLGRVALFGESQGTLIAVRALGLLGHQRLGGLVLVSPVDLSRERIPASVFPAFVGVYQGKNDDLSGRFSLSESLQTCFGQDRLRSAKCVVRAFSKEGHQFRRPETWAYVYGDILGALSGER